MTATERLQQIATTYSAHHEQLHRVVRRRGSSDEHNVQDACSHAWAQLISAAHIDLGPPRCSALAWLRTVAVRRAWELGRQQARSVSIGELDTLGQLAAARGHTSPAATELAEHHTRQTASQDHCVDQDAPDLRPSRGTVPPRTSAALRPRSRTSTNAVRRFRGLLTFPWVV